MLALAALLEADRRLELRQQGSEDACVTRQPQRLRGVLTEQKLRELTHPVGVQAAADALAGDEAHAVCFVAHLLQRRLIRSQTQLGDEAQAAHEAQWVLREAVRADGPQDAALEIGGTPERIDQLARVEAAGDRVDGEVAPRHVVFDGEARVGDDLEVVPPGAGAAFGARRRELDSGRCAARTSLSRG